MKVFIELSGGLDICFDGKKQLEIEFNKPSITAGELIDHLRATCNQKRLEFFVSGQNLRPGILVLINDADWELDEKEQAVLTDKDRVSFISTLHGG